MRFNPRPNWWCTARDIGNMAFNSKNLHYDKQEPSFLRKLKGQFGEGDGRHNVQIARPKRDRLKTADDDDDPLIVDEQGETVEKEEYERRLKGEDPEELRDGISATVTEGSVFKAAEDAGQHERQKLSEIGGISTKKRKVGKIVGVEEEVEDQKSSAAKSAGTGVDQPQKSSNKMVVKDSTASKKKKAKKIKLSFDEPDD